MRWIDGRGDLGAIVIGILLVAAGLTVLIAGRELFYDSNLYPIGSSIALGGLGIIFRTFERRRARVLDKEEKEAASKVVRALLDVDRQVSFVSLFASESEPT